MSEETVRFDSATKLTWIPVSKLSVVWAQAQRPYDDKWAEQIKDNFDPDMFGQLQVTKPNGGGMYHVIDGQHRAAAVQKLWGPKEMVPCVVLDAMDPARAAELFDNINSGRKSVSTVAAFKVRVTAKREPEVSIDRLVRSLGYTIGSDERAKAIGAVGALRFVWANHGPEELKAALRLIQATWGMDPNATSAHIIRGYGELFSRYGRDVNQQRMKEVIEKKYTPGQLLANAKNIRELHGGSNAAAVVELLVAAYNKKVRAGLALEKKTGNG